MYNISLFVNKIPYELRGEITVPITQ